MKKSIVLFVVLSCVGLYACRHVPPGPDFGSGTGTGGSSFCFNSDVLPLFQTKCATAGCHDASTKAKGYQLDSYNNIIRKDIIPFDAPDSKIFSVLYLSDPSKKMPPTGSTPLTEAEKSIIGRWINQGAPNTTNCGPGAICDSTQFAYNANIKPIMNVCVSCHQPPIPPYNHDLTTYEGVKEIALNGLLVKVVIHDPGVSAMPKNLPMLSQCNIAQIKKWVAGGAPNN